MVVRQTPVRFNRQYRRQPNNTFSHIEDAKSDLKDYYHSTPKIFLNKVPIVGILIIFTN